MILNRAAKSDTDDKMRNLCLIQLFKVKSRDVPASGDFPTLLVQGLNYCACLSWFTRELLQLKKLGLMFLLLLSVFLAKYKPLHFLGLLALKAVKQTYPKVLGVTILQDGFFQGLKPSSDVAVWTSLDSTVTSVFYSQVVRFLFPCRIGTS